jgi:hypothetical protein
MCPHDPRALDGLFDKLFDEADIIFHEWGENFLVGYAEKVLNKISKGEKPPSSASSNFPLFTQALHSKLHKSGKRVVLERSPIGIFGSLKLHVLSKINKRVLKKYSGIDEGGLSNAVLKIAARCCGLGKLPENEHDLFRLLVANYCDMMRDRDEKAFHDLKKIHEDNPEKNILVVRGSGHSKLWYDFLKEVDLDVIYSEYQLQYDKWGEIIMKRYADETYTPTDEEIDEATEDALHTRNILDYLIDLNKKVNNLAKPKKMWFPCQVK